MVEFECSRLNGEGDQSAEYSDKGRTCKARDSARSWTVTVRSRSLCHTWRGVEWPAAGKTGRGTGDGRGRDRAGG